MIRRLWGAGWPARGLSGFQSVWQDLGTGEWEVSSDQWQSSSPAGRGGWRGPKGHFPQPSRHPNPPESQPCCWEGLKPGPRPWHPWSGHQFSLFCLKRIPLCWDQPTTWPLGGPARRLTCPTGRPVLGGSCRASSAMSIFLSGPCSPAPTRGRTWERSVEQAAEPHGHRTLHGCHLSFPPATPHTVPEWLHPGDHQGQPASSPGPGPDPKKSGKLAAV